MSCFPPATKKPGEGQRAAGVGKGTAPRRTDAAYDAEELAEKCGMEYGSFRRKMKKVTGYTPKEWVVKERAKDVEHYLKNTHLTLTEVAFTTGFSSTSNLNDFCRAYLLDTPGEIRKKWLETRKCTDSGI